MHINISEYDEMPPGERRRVKSIQYTTTNDELTSEDFIQITL
jgi:hypothetical protein